ncbi:MAG: S9 family peptidase [Chloroflexi bacterium]|nr:S9 family peptidase [Chloroflexota bacterium]
MSTPRPIAVDDLYRIKTAGDVQLSPDGARIAYVLTRIDAEADGYRSNIWIVPAAGGAPAQFTSGSKSDSAPRWSPDGRWLAFLSDREGDKAQLYVMPADGGESRKLTSLPGGAGAAVWSPDGSRILFAARAYTETPPTDEKAKALWAQRPKVINHAHYKDDGQGYTYDAVTQLFVVPAAGGEARALTATARDNRAPAWSPDGTQIAFARMRDSAGAYNLTDIWLLDADGGNARRLTETVGRATSPTWSPDSALIACYGNARSENGLGDPVVHVWIAPVADGAPRMLTAALDRGAMLVAPPAATPGPIWSADGKNVTALIADAGNVHALRITVADSAITRVVSGERWLLSASGSDKAGRIAFIATTSVNPADVYVCDWNGGNEKCLTSINADVLAGLAIPRIERRVFANPNGGTLDGWLVHPLNADGPAPLLVDIHGGPHSFHGNNFMSGYFYRYALAGRGWAVLLLNPTGSGSYGTAFAHNIRARWGEYDLPEQLAAADALVAAGIADANRMAVTGYSYGGFMTSWTVGHTNRFKAAIIGAPVVNLESFHGTSDIGPWFADWEMNARLFNDRELFRKESPITCVDQVQTPCLILHGEGDDRCPVSQGEEFYVGLIAAGKVETQFVRYPGGSHLFIITGRPSHRVDYGRRVIDWLARFIK